MPLIVLQAWFFLLISWHQPQNIQTLTPSKYSNGLSLGWGHGLCIRFCRVSSWVHKFHTWHIPSGVLCLVQFKLFQKMSTKKGHNCLDQGMIRGDEDEMSICNNKMRMMAWMIFLKIIRSRWWMIVNSFHIIDHIHSIDTGVLFWTYADQVIF